MENTPSPNLCGSCTLCCRTAGVEELSKPAGAWCGHCDKGRGCRIYPERPASCREFACTWLAVRLEGGDIPDELRPDRCHVVLFEAGERMVMAQVNPAYPDAWRKGAAMRMLADYAASGTTVAVTAGPHHLVIDASGIHQGAVRGRDAQGNPQVEKVRKIGRVADVPKFRGA
jgi:hypothetical protein